MAVSRALRRAEKRAIERMQGAVSTHKMLAAERLDRIFVIAMGAYETSTVERTRRRSKRREGGDGPPVTETQIDTDNLMGNPAYLGKAIDAMREIKKLLGLDAPTKVNIVDPDRPHLDMTDDEVRRELAAAMREAGVTAAMLNGAIDVEPVKGAA